MREKGCHGNLNLLSQYLVVHMQPSRWKQEHIKLKFWETMALDSSHLQYSMSAPAIFPWFPKWIRMNFPWGARRNLTRNNSSSVTAQYITSWLTVHLQNERSCRFWWSLHFQKPPALDWPESLAVLSSHVLPGKWTQTWSIEPNQPIAAEDSLLFPCLVISHLKPPAYLKPQILLELTLKWFRVDVHTVN